MRSNQSHLQIGEFEHRLPTKNHPRNPGAEKRSLTDPSFPRKSNPGPMNKIISPTTQVCYPVQFMSEINIFSPQLFQSVYSMSSIKMVFIFFQVEDNHILTLGWPCFQQYIFLSLSLLFFLSVMFQLFDWVPKNFFVLIQFFPAYPFFFCFLANRRSLTVFFYKAFS